MTDGDKKLKEAWEKWEVLRAAYDVTRKANDIAQANFQDARDYYYMIYSVYFNADYAAAQAKHEKALIAHLKHKEHLESPRVSPEGEADV